MEMPPRSDWIAFPTSSCTISLMTVTRLFRRGIATSYALERDRRTTFGRFFSVMGSTSVGALTLRWRS